MNRIKGQKELKVLKKLSVLFRCILQLLKQFLICIIYEEVLNGFMLIRANIIEYLGPQWA